MVVTPLDAAPASFLTPRARWAARPPGVWSMSVRSGGLGAELLRAALAIVLAHLLGVRSSGLIAVEIVRRLESLIVTASPRGLERDVVAALIYVSDLIHAAALAAVFVADPERNRFESHLTLLDAATAAL
jgi:hypothetical protein